MDAVSNITDTFVYWLYLVVALASSVSSYWLVMLLRLFMNRRFLQRRDMI